MTDAEAHALLLGWLDARHRSIRIGAVLALIGLDAHACESVPRLELVERDDHDAGVRLAAAIALNHLR